MKRFVKLLSLGMLLTMASCSTSGGESPSSTTSNDSVVSSSSQAQQETDGTIIKRIADQMFDVFGANRNNASSLASAKNALKPVINGEDRGPEAEIPAVLLYMTGVLSDIENVDVINKAFEFTGSYQMGNEHDNQIFWMDIDMTLSVNTRLDKANNKAFLSAYQDLYFGAMHMASSYIFIDVSYNFATNILGDFNLIMNQTSLDDIYYFERVNNECYKSDDSVTTEEEMTAFTNTFNAYKTAFDTLRGSKVVPEGATLRAAQEAYVSTQKYQNRLYGMRDDLIKIKE